jgi:hypothetical protein
MDSTSLHPLRPINLDYLLIMLGNIFADLFWTHRCRPILPRPARGLAWWVSRIQETQVVVPTRPLYH